MNRQTLTLIETVRLSNRPGQIFVAIDNGHEIILREFLKGTRYHANFDARIGITSIYDEESIEVGQVKHDFKTWSVCFADDHSCVYQIINDAQLEDEDVMGLIFSMI